MFTAPTSYGECGFWRVEFTRQKSEDEHQTVQFAPQYTYV